MSALDATSVRRRFLLLRAARWLPTGLLIPVLILLLLDRGFSLGQIGLITAAQGLTVLVLELPTGGLADAIGRRPVLLAAAAFEFSAVALLAIADTLPVLLAVFAFQGIYRALESGPLDAWYVDAALAADSEADIEGGLAAGGVVLGVAIAVGTLASGGLVALDPVSGINPLVVPLLVALVLRVVEFVALVALMTEVGYERHPGALRRSVREVPTVVTDAVRLVRGSTVLLCLVGVELLWGLGMIAFETFTPPQLSAVLGDVDQAAALMGPANAAAWLFSAAGAAAVPIVARRLGAPQAGAIMRVTQGLTTAGIAIAAGPFGVIAWYLLTMGIHGAANPVHQGLLHRAAPTSHRATVLSANSMTGHTGGALGGIALGGLADAASLSTAILAGAVVLAAAAPLYLLAGRAAAQRSPDVVDDEAAPYRQWRPDTTDGRLVGVRQDVGGKGGDNKPLPPDY